MSLRVLAGGSAFAGAVVAGVLATNSNKAKASKGTGAPDAKGLGTTTDLASLAGHTERVQTFGSLAAEYDNKIGWDETVMGLLLLRRWLIGSNATGDVLEVAAGTGRNLCYYPRRKVTSLTLTDASPEMLRTCEAKEQGRDTPVTLVQTEAERLGRAFPARKFDTVVDTFGLCSFEDPVEALRQMQLVCKENGRIVLIEHGASHSWPWLTGVLDQGAADHLINWGCFWNRDIPEIVRQSGLKVERKFTLHFGTTFVYVGRPGLLLPAEEADAAQVVAAVSPKLKGQCCGCGHCRR